MGRQSSLCQSEWARFFSGYKQSSIFSSFKEQRFIFHSTYVSMVGGQGASAHHVHSGTQTDRVATILNAASCHSRRTENSGSGWVRVCITNW